MSKDTIYRQTAIDAILECCSSDYDNEYECGYDDGLRKGVHKLKHLPSAQPEPKWIPCSERLPNKHGESYIVTISYGSVYSSALQWDANCKRWYLSFLNDDGNILVDFIEDVIAWMPLPEPWKGEANDIHTN